MSAPPVPHPLLWDLFCRVIDNHGDLGVCWRLACGLAARGQQVRLWVDDASALAWMAPDGAAGVTVLAWPSAHTPLPMPGQVVVEAFGCDPPEAFVAAMAAMARPPVWINLEYLSAEDYVERSHGLASPRFAEPGRGLMKWFFYPGFTSATGGLLRGPEAAAVPDGPEAMAALEAPEALAAAGTPQVQATQAARGARPGLPAAAGPLRPGEMAVSLFCYPQPPALPALLQALAQRPVVWLATPGAAQQALQGQALPPGHRQVALPWLSQADYSRLLQACDLNLVRGEDSFVQALWAGAPWLWHLYPQHDGAHGPKLQALLDRHLAGAEPALAQAVSAWMRAWNALAAPPAALPPWWAWQQQALRWRKQLLAQADLVSQLLEFVAEKR